MVTILMFSFIRWSERRVRPLCGTHTFTNYLKLKYEDQDSKSALSKSFNSATTQPAYGG